MSRQAKHFYEFGPFRVDAAERRLLRDGQRVQLPPKVFDTLLTLVSNSGHLLTKNELLQTIWPGTFVEENNLTQYVSALRKALAIDGSSIDYIETIPRVGYRFTPGVREFLEDSESVVIENHTRYRIVVKEEESEEAAGGADAETREDESARITAPSPLPGVAPLRLLAASRSSLLSPSALKVFAVLSVVGLAVVLFFIVGKSKLGSDKSFTSVGFKSVAVLPFKTISGEGKEHLGLGMADTLIAKLSRLHQINVRPMSAVHKFTGLGQDPLAAGRSLGVDAVLDGRIQSADGRVRVTVELLSVRDGAVLWTETLDESATDIFTLQDVIAARILDSLPSAVSSEERALLARRYTTNPEAYEAYLKGRFFWNKRTQDDFRKAIEYFEQALRIDPSYAQAYVGLADTYAFLGADGAPRVKAAAMKALELDDTLAEAHTSLAANMLFEWNWTEAEREFRRAVELNPNYATARHWYAYYFAAIGDMENALIEIRRAQELDPLSLIINTDAGQMYYYARQYDRAIERLRKTLEMDPGFIMAHARLGEAYVQVGLYDDAIAELQKTSALAGWNPRGGPVTHAYAVSGRRAEAVKMLAEWKELIARRPQESEPYWLAAVYAALGEKDQAFLWLEKAYGQRHPELVLLKVEPRFDSLRSDPRFVSLLRRMNLGP